MNTIIIVNAIISISLNILFILFINSKGFELCWKLSGRNSSPDKFKKYVYKPKNAIKWGIISAIPVLNAILLLMILLAHIAYNNVKDP